MPTLKENVKPTQNSFFRSLNYINQIFKTNYISITMKSEQNLLFLVAKCPYLRKTPNFAFLTDFEMRLKSMKSLLFNIWQNLRN